MGVPEQGKVTRNKAHDAPKFCLLVTVVVRVPTPGTQLSLNVGHAQVTNHSAVLKRSKAPFGRPTLGEKGLQEDLFVSL